MERTEDEIQAVIDETYGESKFFGMTYEEGIREALEWVLGRNDDSPMEQ